METPYSPWHLFLTHPTSVSTPGLFPSWACFEEDGEREAEKKRREIQTANQTVLCWSHGHRVSQSLSQSFSQLTLQWCHGCHHDKAHDPVVWLDVGCCPNQRYIHGREKENKDSSLLVLDCCLSFCLEFDLWRSCLVYFLHFNWFWTFGIKNGGPLHSSTISMQAKSYFCRV